jgi:uncharacterized protein
VIEENLAVVVTHSVGQLRGGEPRRYGTERLAADNAALLVYWATEMVLGVRGQGRLAAGGAGSAARFIAALEPVITIRRERKLMAETVIDNPRERRFELPVGDALAVAYYENEGGRIVLTHTEVPQELSGRGIGSKLAKAVFEHLQARGARVVTRCEFMAGYAARHPEYAALLSE